MWDVGAEGAALLSSCRVRRPRQHCLLGVRRERQAHHAREQHSRCGLAALSRASRPGLALAGGRSPCTTRTTFSRASLPFHTTRDEPPLRLNSTKGQACLVSYDQGGRAPALPPSAVPCCYPTTTHWLRSVRHPTHGPPWPCFRNTKENTKPFRTPVCYRSNCCVLTGRVRMRARHPCCTVSTHLLVECVQCSSTQLSG